MRTAVVLALFAAPMLAGCTDPPPADAVEARLPDFDGPVVWAWIEENPDQIIFHARFENQRDEPVFLTRGEWPRPWRIDLLDANGTSLPFHNKELFRDEFYDPVGAAWTEEFRYRWNKVLFDHQNRTTMPAPDGDYSFSLGLPIRQFRGNLPVGELNLTLPFSLAADP